MVARISPSPLQYRVVDIAFGTAGIERVALWRIERGAHSETVQQIGIRKVTTAEYRGIGTGVRNQRRGTVPVESTTNQ